MLKSRNIERSIRPTHIAGVSFHPPRIGLKEVWRKAPSRKAGYGRLFRRSYGDR